MATVPPTSGDENYPAMELTFRRNDDLESSSIQDATSKLPRVDGGRDAWLFLAGCFVFEGLVWGFPFSFGVFQSYYTTHPPFSNNTKGVAIIGTCATGVMYLFSPFSLYALEAWPAFRRRSSILGLAITTTALIGTSFSTEVWHLILTQGILYAIGGSFLYAPTVVYLDEWFVKKKGLAFGIMWAGVGTSGLIFPFFLSALLKAYSFRTTLRVWAIVLLVLCTPLIYFVKPRLPASLTPARKPFSASFLTTRIFVFLQASNILESLGFFLPSIYLPSYATSLHLSPLQSTILLALLNSFSVIGAISLGHLCDHLAVTTVIGLSSVVTTLSVLLLWSLGSSFATLACFAAIYGVFAGGFSALWSGMYKSVQKKNPEVGAGVLMGLFSAGRGVGAVLSGPLSEALLGFGGLEGGGGAFGGKYGTVILFTGVSAASGLVCLGAWERNTKS